LTDFFPDFPEYGWQIKVEHLLRHTSGIKDYEPLVAKGEYAEPVMDAEVLGLLAEQNEGDFEAGSRFRYSNSGYAVLSQIVEQVTGVSFPDFLKGTFFDALGMEDSLALVNRAGAAEVSNRAIGYALDADGSFVWSDQGSTSAVLGDGGIYTSAVDYEKWIRAYCEGRVLKPETVERAWKPGVTTTGDVVPYGYGWRLEERGGKWRPYHPGSTTGFRNGVVLDPEAGVIVLVLSNRANGDAVALAKAIESKKM
jgi:CubicO group peptidase (beta-lactamase class C family)